MLANIIITALGAWGVWYTWTRRHQSGGSLFFDMASSVRNPIFYRFAITLRLTVFGACLLIGSYRLLFGIID